MQSNGHIEFSSIKNHFDVSPSIRLVCGNNAPLVIGFFFYAFKAKDRIAIPESNLVSELTQYIEDINETYKTSFEKHAGHYIEYWTHENQRFLRKYYDPTGDEPLFELTYDSERVLEWIIELGKQGFVGTESRFLMIIDMLRKLVSESSQDPEVRLANLEQQKMQIEEEIQKLKENKSPQILTTTQTKERFEIINTEARKLVTDFRLVEQNFREIANELKKKQFSEILAKGKVLGFALNSAEELDNSDQGRSFQAFYEFLRSDSLQEELKTLVNKTLDIEEIIEMLKSKADSGGNALRRLEFNLLDAAQRVASSNRLFTEQIRRLLHEKNVEEAKYVHDLIREVKSLALENGPINENNFVEFEDRVQLGFPLERPLWSPNDSVRFEAESLEVNEGSLLDSLVLEKLASQFNVDKEELIRRIDLMLDKRGMISLKQILLEFPPEKGLAEIIAYLSLATGHYNTAISSEKSDLVKVKVCQSLTDSENKMFYNVKIPSVVFLPAS